MSKSALWDGSAEAQLRDPERLIAGLCLARFVYNVVALVATWARHEWALSLVYAALTAVVPVLVYVRVAAPPRPDSGGPSEGTP